MLINDDIRNLNFENAFEVVLSEMLGSFGDNELSPEILYKIDRYPPKYLFLNNDHIIKG